MEKIARGHSRETNIARGKAECYIRLETKPECYFPLVHSQQCFNWFIVLAGLFEQIAKVPLGATERQSARKVRNLALADDSKAVCLC